PLVEREIVQRRTGRAHEQPTTERREQIPDVIEQAPSDTAAPLGLVAPDVEDLAAQPRPPPDHDRADEPGVEPGGVVAVRWIEQGRAQQVVVLLGLVQARDDIIEPALRPTGTYRQADVHVCRTVHVRHAARSEESRSLVSARGTAGCAGSTCADSPSPSTARTRSVTASRTRP